MTFSIWITKKTEIVIKKKQQQHAKWLIQRFTLCHKWQYWFAWTFGAIFRIYYVIFNQMVILFLYCIHYKLNMLFLLFFIVNQMNWNRQMYVYNIMGTVELQIIHAFDFYLRVCRIFYGHICMCETYSTIRTTTTKEHTYQEYKCLV